MSSIVVAPTRRAENTIYLAFSAVVVIFIQYFGAWISGEDATLPFAPNLVIVGIIAPILSAALIYSVPDEWLLHKLLSRKIESSMLDSIAFFLLTTVALKLYKVRSERVRNPKSVFCEERDVVLEAGTLDTPIWRLRGAIWFFMSLWLTVPMAISIVGFSTGSSTLMILVGFIVSIVVIHPSWKWYIRTSQLLTNTLDFHWLDRLLTAARRSDIAADDPTASDIEVEVTGFTETIYRGIKAAEAVAEWGADKILDVPEVAKPHRQQTWNKNEEIPIRVKGRIVSREKSGIPEKALQDLLMGDVEWLRELLRRNSWSSFKIRFKELNGFILFRGEETLKRLVHLLLEEWKAAMRNNEATFAFTNLRRLCYYLKEYGLLPSEGKDTINEITKYQEEFIVNPNWAYQYYTKRMTESIYVKMMFEDLARHVVDDYQSEEGWQQYQSHVGADLAYLSDSYQKLSGKTLWPALTDDELDKAELMEY